MIHTTKVLLFALALSLAGLGGSFPFVFDGESGAHSLGAGTLPFPSPESSLKALTAAGTQTPAGAQEAPTADFSADRVEIRPGMEIRFADESTGGPASWLWDFGDGGTSAEQNPIHKYEKNGYYTVTLKVTAPNGSDTVKKVDFIRVSEDCNC